MTWSLAPLFYAFLPPSPSSLSYIVWDDKRKLFTINCASQEQRKKKKQEKGTSHGLQNMFVPGSQRDLVQILEHALVHHGNFWQSNPVQNQTKPALRSLFCKLNIFLKNESHCSGFTTRQAFLTTSLALSKRKKFPLSETVSAFRHFSQPERGLSMGSASWMDYHL